MGRDPLNNKYKYLIVYTDGTVNEYYATKTEVEWYIHIEGDHVVKYIEVGENST